MILPDDPILTELLPSFCDDWERQLDVDRWPDLVVTRSRQDLRLFGHTVMGSFAQFGLPEGAHLGKALMACARDDDWERAAGHVDALRCLLSAVRRALAGLPSA
ncbi:MAG: hypothetical protein Q8P41_19595 [Pseudomonadota bacterium]|nr:hypothetical protein [Pseudomonadota bacterium]